MIGILYLSQFRAGLIDARVQSLLVQGEIIAGAIAASATVETDAITIDPDRLLELQTGESYGPPTTSPASNFRSIPNGSRRCCAASSRRPRRARASTTATACCMLDSRNLYGRGDVLRFDLPPPTAEKPGVLRALLDRDPHAGSGAAICRSTANSAPTTARAIRKSSRR